MSLSWAKNSRSSDFSTRSLVTGDFDPGDVRSSKARGATIPELFLGYDLNFDHWPKNMLKTG